MIRFPAPACAGRLRDCPLGGPPIERRNLYEDKDGFLITCEEGDFRFRSSCLSCRPRRRMMGKFHTPKQYIEYIYGSIFNLYLIDAYVANGYKYQTASGRKLLVKRHYSVFIDPRGHFLHARVAAIRVLDSVIGFIKQLGIFDANRHTLKFKTRPYVEFAEFLANFPTW